MAWVAGVGFEFAAELGHVDAQVVGVFRVGRPPHFGQQLAVCDQYFGVPDQDLEDVPPYPCIHLSLCLSMLAGLQGAILLIAATRQDAIAAAMTQHDYDTNVKAKEEIEL